MNAIIFRRDHDELHAKAEARDQGLQEEGYHRGMKVVVPGTMSGCPVINVPVGFNDKGLPMGMQIIGPMGKDFELLQIAYAYEQAARWNYDYQPPALKT